MPNSKSSLLFYSHHFTAMGSPCEIRLYANNENHGNALCLQAEKEIARLEQKYSRYLKHNLLYRINQVAKVGGSITIDSELLALLQYADTCYQQSQGLFDITSGVLRHIWDFSNPENITIPNEKTLEEVLSSVGWQHVSINGNQLSFHRKGMELDFGGIVKEYAADFVANLLQQLGVTSGLVNLGGDIKAIGPHPDGSPWRVKIKNPVKAEQASSKTSYLTEIPIHQEGLATSGDYERCVYINGQRYSHLLSPITGWPVQGLSSATVIAPHCVVAGSAATIALLKGAEGKEWLARLGLDFHAV